MALPRGELAARLTLLGVVVAIQNFFELPRGPLRDMIGKSLTGIVVVAALAAMLALTLVALRPKLPRWRWPRSRIVQAVVLALTLLALPIGIGQNATLLAAGFQPPMYPNDGTTLDHYAAQQLLEGHNPYVTVSLIAAVRLYHQQPDHTTPLGAGRFANLYPDHYPTAQQLTETFDHEPAEPPSASPEFESHVSYPALAFLPLVPLVWAGMPSVVPFFALCYFALLAMLLLSVPPPARLWLALLFVAATSLVNAAVGGVLDVFYIALLFVAWRWWRWPLLSTVFLGLAVATKQLAWFFVPFYAILVWREYGPREAAKRLAGAGTIFLAINAPFILNNAHAWLAGILAPEVDRMFPLGNGLVQLSLAGVLPLLPQTVYTVLELLGFVAALAWYWRHCREYPEMGFVLAVVPLFFAWRSLTTYFYFVALPALALLLARVGRYGERGVRGGIAEDAEKEERITAAEDAQAWRGSRGVAGALAVASDDVAFSVDTRRAWATRASPLQRAGAAFESVGRFAKLNGVWTSARAGGLGGRGPLGADSSAGPSSRGAIGPQTAIEGVRALWARIEATPRSATLALLVAWGATRLVLFAGMLLASPNSFCDPQFYDYAGRFVAGQWPYLNVPVEYPPGAMLLILLPALPLLPFARIAPRPDAAFTLPLTHLPHPDPVRYGAYGISFAVEMLLIDLVALWLVRRAARRLVPGDRYGLRSGLLYIGLVFVSGALLQKFEIAAGMLCLAAVLAMVARREGWAGALLALAALVKGFPLLAIPAFVVYALLRSTPSPLRGEGGVAAATPRGGISGSLPPRRDRGLGGKDLWHALKAAWPRLRRGAIAFAVVAIAPALVVALLAGPSALLHTVVYHADRGTEIESLYGNTQLALGWLPGLTPITRFNPHDLSRVVSSTLDGAVTVAAPLVMGLFLLVTYASLAAQTAMMPLGTGGEETGAREAREGAPSTQRWFVGARSVRPRAFGKQARLPATTDVLPAEQVLLVGTAATLLAFLLAFRALPAHYLLDVLPLAAVIRLPRPHWQAVWFGGLLAVAVCGQALTVVWQALLAFAPGAVVLLSIRNMAWILAFGVLLMALWHRAGWSGWPSRAAGAPGRGMRR